MDKIHFTGSVQDGKLKLSNRKEFDELISLYEGKRIEGFVWKLKKRRSNPQNSYYWGLVIPIMVKGFKDLGHDVTKEIVHDFLKGRFLPDDIQVVSVKSGEVIQFKNTTTKLTTTQMMDYIDNIARFASEFLGVVIPPPTPLWDQNNTI